jgi:WD40 repeat protein
MDPRRLVVSVLLIAAACGGNSAGSGSALKPGSSPSEPASGLALGKASSTGLLGYASSLANSDTRIAAIELSTDFDLVVYDLDAQGSSTESARVTLGPADYDVSALAVAPGAKTAWLASKDGTVRAINLDSGDVEQRWQVGAAATAIAVAQDSAYVAIGTETGVICLRRAADSALLQCVVGHDMTVSALQFAGDRLASASWDGSVLVWEIPSLAVVAKQSGPGSANGLAFGPDGNVLAIARSGRPPKRSPTDVATEKAKGFSTPAPGATVEIWHLGQEPRRCQGHGGPVTSVAWLGNQRVVSASWDRTLRLWKSSNCQQLAKLTGFAHLIRSV